MSQPLRYNKHEIPCIAMMDRNKGPVGCLKLWTTQTHTHTYTLRNMFLAVQATLNKKTPISWVAGNMSERGDWLKSPCFFFGGHHYTLNSGEQVHPPILTSPQPFTPPDFSLTRHHRQEPQNITWTPSSGHHTCRESLFQGKGGWS